MLCELFTASLLLLVCNYIKTINKYIATAIILVAACVTIMTGSFVFFSCLLGYCISVFSSKISSISMITGERSLQIALVAILLISCMHSTSYSFLNRFINVPRTTWWNPAYAALIFMLIMNTPKIQDMLSTKKIKYLGEISFEIYCFHWPLMCSLGILIFLLLYQTSYIAAFTLSLIVILIATLAASILFNKTFDRLSTFIINIAVK